MQFTVVVEVDDVGEDLGAIRTLVVGGRCFHTMTYVQVVLHLSTEEKRLATLAAAVPRISATNSIM